VFLANIWFKVVVNIIMEGKQANSRAAVYFTNMSSKNRFYFVGPYKFWWACMHHWIHFLH